MTNTPVYEKEHEVEKRLQMLASIIRVSIARLFLDCSGRIGDRLRRLVRHS